MELLGPVLRVYSKLLFLPSLILRTSIVIPTCSPSHLVCNKDQNNQWPQFAAFHMCAFTLST